MVTVTFVQPWFDQPGGALRFQTADRSVTVRDLVVDGSLVRLRVSERRSTRDTTKRPAPLRGGPLRRVAVGQAGGRGASGWSYCAPGARLEAPEHDAGDPAPTKEISQNGPARPASCTRRHPRARDGMKVASPTGRATEEQERDPGNPPVEVVVPYSSVVVASDTHTISDATYAPSRTTTTMAFARYHHQTHCGSRDPSKRAYFFRTG